MWPFSYSRIPLFKSLVISSKSSEIVLLTSLSLSYGSKTNQYLFSISSPILITDESTLAWKSILPSDFVYFSELAIRYRLDNLDINVTISFLVMIVLEIYLDTQII